MTSSFTNFWLASRVLATLTRLERYRRICQKLSQIAAELSRNYLAAIAGIGSRGFGRAIFLASGAGLGAAREATRKMLEVTAGLLATRHASYLGFRHGPI